MPSLSAETRARFNSRKNCACSASLRGTPMSDTIVTRGAFFIPRSRKRLSICFAMTIISASCGGKKFVWDVRLKYGTFPLCVYCTPAHEKRLIKVFCFETASSALSQPAASFTSALCASRVVRVTRRFARPVMTVLKEFQTGPMVGSPEESRRNSTSPRSFTPSSATPGQNFK